MTLADQAGVFYENIVPSGLRLMDQRDMCREEPESSSYSLRRNCVVSSEAALSAGK